MDMSCSTVRPVGAAEVWEEAKNEALNWPSEQDCYLNDLISSYGTHSWSQVAEQMNITFPGAQKTGKQCRERWRNKLDLGVNRSPWTKQEEAQLLLSHMRLRNHWREIAATFNGRHNNMVKNLFYSIFRRVKNKLQTQDYSCKTKLEAVEVYYILSLIDFYITHPLSGHEPKRRRGKDFLHTLVSDISPAQLELFKAGIKKHIPLKTPLEQLLVELITGSRAHNPDRANIPALPNPRIDSMEQGPTSGPAFTSQEEPKTALTPCSYNVLLTLPFPQSFNSPEGLTPEEKLFIRQHFFPPTSRLGSAAFADSQQPRPLFGSEGMPMAGKQPQTFQTSCGVYGVGLIMNQEKFLYRPLAAYPSTFPFCTRPSPTMEAIAFMQKSNA